MRFPLALLLTATLQAPALAAEPAELDYQKKAVSVIETSGDLFGQELRQRLVALGRFDYLPVVASTADRAAAIAQVAAAAKAAGLSASQAYAFVPRYAFAPIQMVPVKVNENWDKGKLDATAYAAMESELTGTVDVVEVSTGRLIKQLSFNDTLSRRFEYHYDETTSREAIQYKANELTNAMAREATRPPAEAFASQGRSAFAGMAGRLAGAVRQMPEFELKAGVTGWSAENDRIFFNLGSALNVRPDDTFKVMHDGRQIGFVKAREVDTNASHAQPIFMDGVLAKGDRIIEYPRANVWNGLKVGGGWLGVPVFNASYGLQWDIAPAWRGSETYFTTDLGMMTDGRSGGFMGTVGLMKKVFVRRWGFSYGAKAGLATLASIVPSSVALPVVGAAGGFDCYLTPDIIWTNDLDLQAIWPAVSKTGPNAGKVIFNWGPVLRTGLTVVF